MKSEHRHELQTNTLAYKLNDWGDKLRPHTSSIVTGICIVLAIYVLSMLWNARSAQREAAAWDAYQLAVLQGQVDYRGVRQAAESADLGGSRMQEWGYITWADRQLRLASYEYLMNREEAKDKLTGVAAVYEQFATDAEDPIVRSRAQLGQARVSEMENKLEEARELYAAVEGVMASVAQARLKELESTPKIEETIAWLATTELPKPPAPTSQGGLPGRQPEFEATVPASDANADPFDPAQSLEDILGGAAGADAEGRYREDAASEETGDSVGDAAPDASDEAAEETATGSEEAKQQETEQPESEQAGGEQAEGGAAEEAPAEEAADDEPGTPAQP